MTPQELENWPLTAPPTEAEVGRIRRQAVALGGFVTQNPHKRRSALFEANAHIAYQRTVMMASCDVVALFTIPLERQGWQAVIALKDWSTPGPATTAQQEADGTKHCVVDDAAHLWPRFQS